MYHRNDIVPIVDCSVVRSNKVSALQNQYEGNPNVEIVVVEDITTGDFSQALDGEFPESPPLEKH